MSADTAGTIEDQYSDGEAPAILDRIAQEHIEHGHAQRIAGCSLCDQRARAEASEAPRPRAAKAASVPRIAEAKQHFDVDQVSAAVNLWMELEAGAKVPPVPQLLEWYAEQQAAQQPGGEPTLGDLALESAQELEDLIDDHELPITERMHAIGYVGLIRAIVALEPALEDPVPRGGRYRNAPAFRDVSRVDAGEEVYMPSDVPQRAVPPEEQPERLGVERARPGAIPMEAMRGEKGSPLNDRAAAALRQAQARAQLAGAEDDE